MVKFFVIQIRLGRITIEQVPERYREEVRAENKGFIITTGTADGNDSRLSSL